MSRLTQDEWEAQYLPMTNHITNDGLSYETYGDELDYVTQQDDRFVWTELDGEDGVYIVSGYHFVNRIQYYITQKPWDKDISIPVCLYKDCDCADEGEGDPDCQECNGDGMITFWVDTREELEEIYGKESNE